MADETSLVVVDSEGPAGEARRWWNWKDTPVLDDLVAAAPQLLLGTTVDDDFDWVPGPAYRVFSLLFLRGTTPEYVVPRLDDELISEILGAYQGKMMTPPELSELTLQRLPPSWRLIEALECSPLEPGANSCAVPAVQQ